MGLIKCTNAPILSEILVGLHYSAAKMSAQHGRPGSLSTRRTHHSKARDRGSKRETLAESKTVARFIYGSHDVLRPQHLQDILGASGTLPSPEAAPPSYARTHFYQTSRPRLFLRAACLSSHYVSPGRELGGDVRRIMQFEQRASAPEGWRFLRPASPATRTASTPSSAAHRHAPGVATPPAARTLKMAASCPSLRMGTEKGRPRPSFRQLQDSCSVPEREGTPASDGLEPTRLGHDLPS